MPQEFIAKPFPCAADLLHSLLGVARHAAICAVPAFTLRPRSHRAVATSITASTVELPCEEPRLGAHSIRLLSQQSGACLSGPPGDLSGRTYAISPDLRSSPVLLTPMGVRRLPTPRSLFGCLGTGFCCDVLLGLRAHDSTHGGGESRHVSKIDDKMSKIPLSLPGGFSGAA